jgi:hypothetical protein
MCRERETNSIRQEFKKDGKRWGVNAISEMTYIWFVTSIKWKVKLLRGRHGFKGRGCQGLCDGSNMALVMKSVTVREGVSIIFQICVTSYLDDP